MTVMMDTSVYSSPIRAYIDNRHKMHVSHDENRSDPKDLYSLGVVDLDLSLSPDAFGLQAFDSKKLLTRMLPGSFPCELRLMLPDSKIATNGFHDIVATWPLPLLGVCRHISPEDATSLRRRWPTMQKLSKEVEWAFRHNYPGFCSICQEDIASALDIWSWENCGGARSNGALLGRAPSVTAWDICMKSMGDQSMYLSRT